MKITEYLDAINTQLRITYYPNQKRRFCCNIVGAEVKCGAFLKSSFGDGESPTAAAKAYFDSIVGQTLVFNADSKDSRREFIVPDVLEVDI